MAVIETIPDYAWESAEFLWEDTDESDIFRQVFKLQYPVEEGYSAANVERLLLVCPEANETNVGELLLHMAIGLHEGGKEWLLAPKRILLIVKDETAKDESALKNEILGGFPVRWDIIRPQNLADYIQVVNASTFFRMGDGNGIVERNTAFAREYGLKKGDVYNPKDALKRVDLKSRYSPRSRWFSHSEDLYGVGIITEYAYSLVRMKPETLILRRGLLWFTDKMNECFTAMRASGFHHSNINANVFGYAKGRNRIVIGMDDVRCFAYGTRVGIPVASAWADTRHRRSVAFSNRYIYEYAYVDLNHYLLGISGRMFTLKNEQFNFVRTVGRLVTGYDVESRDFIRVTDDITSKFWHLCHRMFDNLRPWDPRDQFDRDKAFDNFELMLLLSTDARGSATNYAADALHLIAAKYGTARKQKRRNARHMLWIDRLNIPLSDYYHGKGNGGPALYFVDLLSVDEQRHLYRWNKDLDSDMPGASDEAIVSGDDDDSENMSYMNEEDESFVFMDDDDDLVAIPSSTDSLDDIRRRLRNIEPAPFPLNENDDSMKAFIAKIDISTAVNEVARVSDRSLNVLPTLNGMLRTGLPERVSMTFLRTCQYWFEYKSTG